VLLELGVNIVQNSRQYTFCILLLKKRSVGLKFVVSLDVARDFIEEVLTKFQMNLKYP
jgi:hypothetical protein